MLRRTLLLAGLAASASANPAVRRQATTPAATSASSPSITAVSGCHMHGTTQFCMNGADEFQVVAEPTVSLASSYTGCHLHGTETYCFGAGGSEVRLTKEGDESHAATSTTSAAPGGTTVPARPPITVITSCSIKESSLHCLNDATEYVVKTKMTQTTDVPAQVTGCHSHGVETYCMLGDADVAIAQVGSQAAEEEGDADSSERHCHFHAGIEHCTGGASEEPLNCSRPDRDYNIPIRIGILFVLLVTSAIGVFGPIFLSNFFKVQTSVVLVVLKQFGTGVIISTAFVHLFTHASLMFNNECLGELGYEATTAAILMAGIFISFIVDYLAHRALHNRAARLDLAAGGFSAQEVARVEMTNIIVLEAGIVFHSLLIGITLAVAGDSFFATLAVVIVFHQMFEGIALGTRIAAVGSGTSSAAVAAIHGGHFHHHHGHFGPEPKVVGSPVLAPGDAESNSNSSTAGAGTVPAGASPAEKAAAFAGSVSLWKKLALAATFAFVTPIGMGIGIGVLNHFNGNDPSTIIAIGTLNAFSAGILVWVGVVEMLARDWTGGGELAPAGAHGSRTLVIILAMTGLVAGLVVMSLLGKWA